jgi:hypothetical protein
LARHKSGGREFEFGLNQFNGTPPRLRGAPMGAIIKNFAAIDARMSMVGGSVTYALQS